MSLEFKHGTKTYRAGKLDAKKQFHVVRRLGTLLPALSGMGSNASVETALEPLVEAMGKISDADADYILDTCMNVVERKSSAGGWSPVMASGSLMFEDIDMAGMLTIAWNVLLHNLSGFFDGLPKDLSGMDKAKA